MNLEGEFGASVELVAMRRGALEGVGLVQATAAAVSLR